MNRVVIEANKLQHNIDIVKDKMKSTNKKTPQIIGVLKGNAYGMDSLIVAKKLIDNNITFFAVSEVQEAIKLRENGYNNPILLLQSTCVDEDIENIIKYNLIATVGSYDAIKKLNDIAQKQNKVAEAHLKIDTGFGRFGFVSEEVDEKEIASFISRMNNIKISGIYSHFYESYSKDTKSTKEQFRKFMKITDRLKEHMDVGMRHICNSPAFFKYPEMYLEAVRIGSALTGNVQIQESTGLQKVGYLESEVCEIKELPKSYTIGYSATEKLKKDARVAIICAGYADGIGLSGKKDSNRFIDKLRLIKNTFNYNRRVTVEINNQKCDVLGRIGMKNIIVNINGKNVNVGDKVKISTNLVFVDSNIIRQEL